MTNAFIITPGGNRFAKEESQPLEANSVYASSDLQLLDVFLRSRVSAKTRITYEKCIADFINFLAILWYFRRSVANCHSEGQLFAPKSLVSQREQILRSKKPSLRMTEYVGPF